MKSSSFMTRRLVIAAAALLSVSAVAGFAAIQREDSGVSEARSAGNSGVPTRAYRPIEIHVDRMFPMTSLVDVALRADAILVGTPISEVEVEDPEVIERGEGYLGRRITVQVDRTLWQKPGVPGPPSSIETGGGSWRYSDGNRTPFIIFGELGKQYLFVFDHNSDPLDENGYEWNHEMTLGVPMIDGRTPAQIVSDKPYLRAIEGKSVEELERLFASSLRR